MAAISWSRRKSIPLVLEIVNNVNSPYQYLPGTRKFRSYDLSRQSVIVAISKHLSDLCESAGLKENVWTRPNPVDTQIFRPTSRDHRARVISTVFGFEESEKVIVYVAKFMKQKNHEFLIDVMDQLPVNFKLVLAGPTVTPGEIDPGWTSEQISQLQARVKRSGLGARVRITPEYVDTAEYLSGADVFCFPAHNEAMGTPMLEALASGVPVVANEDEASFREWIVDGENGYLAPLQVEQWATAVRAAAEFDETHRGQIARSVSARVSADSIDEQYFRLMNKLLETGSHEIVDVDKVLSK